MPLLQQSNIPESEAKEMKPREEYRAPFQSFPDLTPKQEEREEQERLEIRQAFEKARAAAKVPLVMAK